jgi:hypothetical protein
MWAGGRLKPGGAQMPAQYEKSAPLGVWQSPGERLIKREKLMCCGQKLFRTWHFTGFQARKPGFWGDGLRNMPVLGGFSSGMGP